MKIRMEQVPDEVVWKLHDKLWGSTQFSVEEGRAAIAAALGVWPGIGMGEAFTDEGEVIQNARILLPLSVGARNE